MEERIAIVAVIVENRTVSDRVNQILATFGERIVGRMGLPNVSPGLDVITLVVKGPQQEIAALSGKLGMVKDIQCRTLYSKEKS